MSFSLSVAPMCVNHDSTVYRDAVDWLTWTWMYRRLVANANYYNMQGTCL